MMLIVEKNDQFCMWSFSSSCAVDRNINGHERIPWQGSNVLSISNWESEVAKPRINRSTENDRYSDFYR